MRRTISVAPMMDCTDRHDRFFLRLISKNVMLYSEMVATKSAIHGDKNKILKFNPVEKPLALQVGGSDKKELSEVAKIPGSPPQSAPLAMRLAAESKSPEIGLYLIDSLLPSVEDEEIKKEYLLRKDLLLLEQELLWLKKSETLKSMQNQCKKQASGALGSSDTKSGKNLPPLPFFEYCVFCCGCST